MKQILKFILVGLIFGLSAEVVNQIYWRHSIPGFFGAVVIYVIFLFVVAIFRRLYNRIIKKKFWNILVWYLLFGCLGLFVELNYLGNAGAAWYSQLGMFTAWGTFALMPVIFVERPLETRVTSKIFRYSLVWILAYIILGAVNAQWGMAIWLFGSSFLNYFYFKYFKAVYSTN